MDNTYIRVEDQWKKLYRTVDAVALHFFRMAIRNNDMPDVVNIDKSDANTAALAMLNTDNPEEECVSIRQSRYLNNLV